MTFKGIGKKRAFVIAAAGLALVVGGGAAIAAGTNVFDPKAERDAFQAAVANKLGVTTQQLQDAYKAAALERLDAAVKAGRITEEQASAIRDRIESGDVGPMFFGPMGRMHGPGFGAGGLDAAATYLGLTEAELHAKLEAGQSLADVAKAQGKSVDGLKSAMLADLKTRLDQAVSDGKITAAQRDEMLKNAESKLDDVINGTGSPKPRFGHNRGFGFRSGDNGEFGARFQGTPDA